MGDTISIYIPRFLNDISSSLKRIINKLASPISVETFIVLIFFFGGWMFLYLYSGGPTDWDELLYMHSALNPGIDFHPDRAFHIYSLKLFFWFTHNPFDGAKLFWSFLISTTALFIYLVSRGLSGRSSYLNGLVAILFFFAHHSILPRSGVTWADYTVMMWITVSVAVYLLYFRLQNHRNAILFLFGLIFFLTIKTKESALAFTPLLLGFGFSPGGGFDLRRLLRNSMLILAGMLAGQILLMLLDHIFLGNALHGFSLFVELRSKLNDSSPGNLVSTNLVVANQIYSLALNEFLAPFLLYGLSIARRREFDFRPYEKIIWLLPISYIVLLGVVLAKPDFRRFIPIIPIIMICASQFFESSVFPTLRSQARSFVTILLPGALVAAALLKVRWPGTLETAISLAISFVVVLTILLVLSIATRKWHPALIVTALVGVFLVTIPSIDTYLTEIVHRSSVSHKTNRRWAPLQLSAPFISCEEARNIYVSGNLYYQNELYARDTHSALWMFNLFFQCNLDLSQVTYHPGSRSYYALQADPDYDIQEDLIKNEHAYLYLHQSDWDSLSATAQQILLNQYQPEQDGEIVFLHPLAARKPRSVTIEEVIQAQKNSLYENPFQTVLAFELVDIYNAVGDWEQAIDFMKWLLEQEGDNPETLAEIYFKLGEIDYKRGQWEAAMGNYLQATAVQPNNEQYARSLARAYIKNLEMGKEENGAENSITNGGFENGQEGWIKIFQTGENGTFLSNDDDRIEGQSSGLIEGTTDEYHAGWFQQVTLKPDTIYLIHLWVKAEGPRPESDAEPRVMTPYISLDDGRSRANGAEFDFTGSSAWTQKWSVFRTPGDPDVLVTLYPVLVSGLGRVWVDDIRLVNLSEAIPPDEKPGQD